MQRVVSMTANIQGRPLGEVSRLIDSALKQAGEPPRGTTVAVRGQIPALEETLSGLRLGLLIAIGAIFLLLAASFQSVKLALVVLLTIPAAVCGSLLMLLVTGTTLNVQSYMGTIMAIGIAVANTILFVSFAEAERLSGCDARTSAVAGGQSRLRAILMTASAMIAGMVPIAMGAVHSAPRGRAGSGGLILATLATRSVAPAVYTILQQRASARSASLLDQESL